MSHCFRVVAVPDPQALPRIVGIFAQRSLVPTRLTAENRDGMLHIEAMLTDLDPTTATIIAAKLAEAVLVTSATCHPAKNARMAGRKSAAVAA